MSLLQEQPCNQGQTNIITSNKTYMAICKLSVITPSFQFQILAFVFGKDGPLGCTSIYVQA